MTVRDLEYLTPSLQAHNIASYWLANASSMARSQRQDDPDPMESELPTLSDVAPSQTG